MTDTDIQIIIESIDVVLKVWLNYWGNPEEWTHLLKRNQGCPSWIHKFFLGFAEIFYAILILGLILRA